MVIRLLKEFIFKIKQLQLTDNIIINKQVGVICFYNSQISNINEKITDDIDIEYFKIGNVDSFQGMEFPYVILVCSRHDIKNGKVGFLKLANRINVAVSRAQSQLIIVGSYETLCSTNKYGGSKPIKDFVNAAGNNLLKIINGMDENVI
jgi:superfamily I DNA and/or RNA helicase